MTAKKQFPFFKSNSTTQNLSANWCCWAELASLFVFTPCIDWTGNGIYQKTLYNFFSGYLKAVMWKIFVVNSHFYKQENIFNNVLR